jgi:hypothetical protein
VSQYILISKAIGPIRWRIEMELIGIVLTLFLFGLVGFFIDRDRGFVWGFFLGPIGWIIAAILKEKHGLAVDSRNNTSSITTPVNTTKNNIGNTISPNSKKWSVLKEIDPDIKRICDDIYRFAQENKFDPVEIEGEVRIKFFDMGEDKKYLDNIVAASLAVPRERVITVVDKLEIKSGGRKVILNVTDDGKFNALNYAGEVKVFDSIEEARKYFVG